MNKCIGLKLLALHCKMFHCSRTCSSVREEWSSPKATSDFGLGTQLSVAAYACVVTVSREQFELFYRATQAVLLKTVRKN